MSMKRRVGMMTLIGVTAIVALFGRRGTVNAEPLTHGKIYNEISTELNKIAKMLTDGTSPAATLRYCCTADYIADGQGYKTPLQGAALLPLQTEEMQEIKAPCSFSIDSPIESSGKIASAFVTLRCRPAKSGAPEFVQKSIFVWRLTKSGWKLVQEMDVYPNEAAGS